MHVDLREPKKILTSIGLETTNIGLITWTDQAIDSREKFAGGQSNGMTLIH